MSSSQEELLGRLRTGFNSGKTRSLEFRLSQLQALKRLLDENRQAINEALAQDLHKPGFEAEVSEISFLITEINVALNNLKTWMKDEHVEKNWATKLNSAFIRKDPFGVVLIIGAWNYPIQLLLNPLVGAIGAGNCAILKPSELSKSTEKLVSNLLPRYLDQECFAVVCGGPQEISQLLENKFDYIFFTGNASVGKIIMAAASKHLTPVTLELGGKNPCFVDNGCNPKNIANRLAWVRFFNAGQTCVAPDYVLCTWQMREQLLSALKETLETFYGKEPQQSSDFGRIINDRHFQRVKALLQSGSVAIGGQSDKSDKYIAPTVLVDVQESDPVMQEEIFGPILPILTVESPEEAIAFINRQEKPLAFYAFSPDSKVIDAMLDRTSSGGFCGNDGMMHMTLPSLPFGGIGHSGMGNYHGKFSFNTFSHHRAVLLRSPGLEKLNTLRYPPYTKSNLGLLLCATEVKQKGMCTLL
ncbi:aldehyde dehydrogenase family 3 member B1-like [Ambystoma mexicanum]|uniref:aldehyde dehydrogenase family 3 member B1-like n=1 Tax=Ambystoma mexicanum TaxID=8296 RepID=UPI0037E900DB